MNVWLTYGLIAVILLIAELIYFRIADKCNIIDKPNGRSSHSSIVVRGGGVIFAISMIVWSLLMVVQGVSGGASADFCHDSAVLEQAQTALAAPKVQGYLPFMIGLVMICTVSFWDDVKSLPVSVRLVVQFTAMGLMLYQLIIDNGQLNIEHWWGWMLLLLAASIVCVGATNIINFMDGINGITAGYALAVILPLLMLDVRGKMDDVSGFIEPSYLIVAMIGVLVFCIFNFRPKGKAKCFAGDVGSIGIAFIMLFAIGKLILATNDVTWLIFLLVYGVDGCCTIIHRMMLHENLGEAHRKHAFQLMANELKMGHMTVSLIYMGLQLAVSLGFIYLIPNTIVAHWIYSIVVGLLLVCAYLLFMRKYYHLHEEYLASLKIKFKG